MEQFVSGLLRAWNDRDVGRVVAYYAADYTGCDVAEADPQRGTRAVHKMVTRLLGAFPDLRFTSEQVVIEDNRVALAWKAEGTHQGRILNIPPTGRAMTVHGVWMLTIEDGRVTQGLNVWDVAGLLRDLGLLPQLP